jgi:uncharacterized protein YigE (DUF2233 family)
MFEPDKTPVGLFIENEKHLTPINKRSGKDNFYLKPNGIFYITTDNLPVICKTEDFNDNGKIKYATQSGPMLIIDGYFHPIVKKARTSLNIRNGVGILPGNKIVFVMSKVPISLYDFADYFKTLSCQNALYLDGAISRTYLPEKNWVQTDGDFGGIIGVVEDQFLNK